MWRYTKEKLASIEESRERRRPLSYRVTVAQNPFFRVE
jgi:hypothetical protein